MSRRNQVEAHPKMGHPNRFMNLPQSALAGLILSLAASSSPVFRTCARGCGGGGGTEGPSQGAAAQNPQGRCASGGGIGVNLLHRFLDWGRATTGNAIYTCG